jgi:ribokinase
VVDVTGAGDSFGGGFAVGLRQTGDPLRAVLMGTVSASFVVEGWGALYGLDPPAEEVARRLAFLEDRVESA